MKSYWGKGLVALLVAAAAPCYWSGWQLPSVGTYHDDSIYLETARSLAEGRGYRIESVPEGMAQTKYPILFPAVLSVVWKLWPEFPANLPIFKGVVLAWGVAWLCLSVALLRRWGLSGTTSALIAALVLGSPQVMALSTMVLSETMYAALTTLALWTLVRWEESREMKWVVWAAMASAAAYHTRSMGLAVIGAGCVVLLWRRAMREAMVFAAICVLLASPWWLWQWQNKTAASAYLSSANYYQSYNLVLSFDWPEKLQIFKTNLLMVATGFGFYYGKVWMGVLSFCTVPFALRGLWMAFRGSGKQLGMAVYFSFSIVLILLWAWPPQRFLMPLLPLGFLLVWQGAGQKWKWALTGFGAIFLGSGLWAGYETVEAARGVLVWNLEQKGKSPWIEFTKQMEWVKQNTRPEEILQCNVDPTAFLLSGRKAIRGSEGNVGLTFYLDKKNPLGNADEFREELLRRHVSIVVNTPWTWFMETKHFDRLLAECLQRWPEEFQEVYRGGEANYAIYRFSPAR